MTHSRISLIALLAMALAACGTSDGSSTTTSEPTVDTTAVTETTAPTSTAAPTTAPPTTAAAETTSTITESESTASSDEGRLTGGDSCVVGTWEMDTANFAAQLADEYAQSGLDADVSVEGRSVVEFREDGGFTGGYDDLTAMVETSDAAFPGISITFSGAGEGSWAADGTQLEVRTDSLDVTTETLIGGQPVGDLGFDTPDVAGFETQAADYVCDDQTLTFEVDGGIEYSAQRID